MSLQDVGTIILDNLPTWLVLLYLAYLWRKERNQAQNAQQIAVVEQVRVLSAAHETLLVTNTTMSKRFDEMEALRGKERHERDLEREAEEKARCEYDAKVDVLQRSIETLTSMTHKQQSEIDTLQEEVKRRDARIAELEKKLDEREKKLDERDQRITDLERKSADLKGEREMLLAKVAELSGKVEDLQKRGTGPLAEPGEQKSADASAASASEETI